MAKDLDVLDDMKDQLVAALTERLGISSQDAQVIAHQIREHFRMHWGGQNIYFTKSKDLAPRDREIYERFNGRNKEELVREFNISEQTFYNIIRKVKADYIAKMQTSFDF